MQLSHPWMTEKRGLRGLTWLSGTAGICDFVGSFPPFTSPTSSQPFTRQKRERGEVERERSEFHFFLLWTRKWQQPSLLNHHQPTSLGPRIHVPSEKFPEFQMLHNHKKLSVAGKTTPLREHKANHSPRPWTVRGRIISPHLGLKP